MKGPPNSNQRFDVLAPKFIPQECIDIRGIRVDKKGQDPKALLVKKTIFLWKRNAVSGGSRSKSSFVNRVKFGDISEVPNSEKQSRNG